MVDQTLEDRFSITKKGIVVNVSKGAALPGTFMNMLHAERAYEKFLAQKRAAKKDRVVKK